MALRYSERLNLFADLRRISPVSAEVTRPDDEVWASKVLERFNLYFSSRFFPYSTIFEYAVGGELYLHSITRGNPHAVPKGKPITAAAIATRTGQDEELVLMILTGLYSRRRVDDGEVGQVAKEVGANMKTLRRIGVEAETFGIKVKLRPDPGFAFLIDTAMYDATVAPSRYAEGASIGLGMRSAREILGINRRMLVARSGVPLPFIAFLEHNCLPAEMLQSQMFDSLLGFFQVERGLIRGIGNWVMQRAWSSDMERLQLLRLPPLRSRVLAPA